MRAELLLRLASDPDAIRNPENAELRELLAEPKPPDWVFAEAARRTNNEKIMAHLFSHPAADVDLLKKTLEYDTKLLDRFKHRAEVFEGKPELSTILANVIPEASGLTFAEHPSRLLLEQLSPLCVKYLYGDNQADVAEVHHSPDNEHEASTVLATPDISEIPRRYSPLARVIILGDFLYYLSAEDDFETRDLPILAQVALALNPKQPLEPFLKNADIRIRLAARKRQSWNVN